MTQRFDHNFALSARSGFRFALYHSAEPGSSVALTSLKTIYRPELDGLRAIAVVSVIAHHFGKGLLPSGYLGVDIFFVISGFVITASLCDRPAASLGDFLLEFYGRRIKRLMPALVACVALTGLLISLFSPDPSDVLMTGVAALFGVANFQIYGQALGYSGSAAALNPYTHTWSLGVEEQFYLLFPLTLWLVGRNRLLPALLLAAAVSLAAFLYFSERSPQAAYYLTPFRLWELAAGCAAFLIRPERFVVRGHVPEAALLLLMACLFVPANYASAATVAVVAATMVLVMTLQRAGMARDVLGSRAAAYVGQLSYSLYLWHWVVLCLSRWTIGISWWTVPGQLGLMALLAITSFHFIEQPLRYARWAPTGLRTLTYGFIVAGVSGLAMYALANPLNGKLFAGTRPAMEASGVESLTNAYATREGSHTWAGMNCVLTSNDDVGKIIPTTNCTLGEFLTAPRRVLVLGNSFSTAFVGAFDQLVEADRYAVTMTSAWGASPVPGMANRTRWDKANDYYWNVATPALMAKLQPHDVVLLASDIAGFSPPTPTANSQANLRSFEMGLSSLSDRLSPRGIRLAIIHGNPFLREANCDPSASPAHQWFTVGPGPCQFFSKKQTLERRAGLDAVLVRLRDRKGLEIIDLLPVFCPGEVCTYENAAGQILYRDPYSHPSVEAARLSAPLLRRALQDAEGLRDRVP